MNIHTLQWVTGFRTVRRIWCWVWGSVGSSYYYFYLSSDGWGLGRLVVRSPLHCCVEAGFVSLGCFLRVLSPTTSCIVCQYELFTAHIQKRYSIETFQSLQLHELKDFSYRNVSFSISGDLLERQLCLSTSSCLYDQVQIVPQFENQKRKVKRDLDISAQGPFCSASARNLPFNHTKSKVITIPPHYPLPTSPY